jgi:eukaryotic-like serine/threonine-protein kinase
MSSGLPSPIRVMPDVLPTRIGPYPIRAVIGAGSMGVVYLGHDPAIDRPVAVKTIRRHLLEPTGGQEGAAARFRVEARAAGRLNHPGIVSVHQLGEDADCAYIVMEYVRGHSLADYLRSPERLTKGEVLCLMYQLLDALHYAHESGVVHRDIKPANLIVDRKGRLKITDFGIARTDTSQATRGDTLVGSPGYMAPEQYTGGPFDRRVDVFSAGVLLYEMLAGKRPFLGSDESIMYQIVYSKHQSLVLHSGDASLAGCEPVLDKALAKAPGQRYATALEFLEALKFGAGGTAAEQLVPDRLLPFKAPQILGAAPAVTGSSPSRPASAPNAVDTTGSGGPLSEPVPTGWDETELVSLERELTRQIGPIAKVLVRRAARGQVDVTVVRQLVAASIIDPDARQRFLAHGGAAAAAPLPRTGPPSGFGESLSAVPTDETRLIPLDLEKATAVLRSYIGPIAGVLVKQCADKTATRERFVARILEQMVDHVDAKTLEAELWRSMG